MDAARRWLQPVWLRPDIYQFLDMFLREPITKLAFRPAALMAGLIQWRQGGDGKQPITFRVSLTPPVDHASGAEDQQLPQTSMGLPLSWSCQTRCCHLKAVMFKEIKPIQDNISTELFPGLKAYVWALGRLPSGIRRENKHKTLFWNQGGMTDPCVFVLGFVWTPEPPLPHQLGEIELLTVH